MAASIKPLQAPPVPASYDVRDFVWNSPRVKEISTTALQYTKDLAQAGEPGFFKKFAASCIVPSYKHSGYYQKVACIVGSIFLYLIGIGFIIDLFSVLYDYLSNEVFPESKGWAKLLTILFPLGLLFAAIHACFTDKKVTEVHSLYSYLATEVFSRKGWALLFSTILLPIGLIIAAVDYIQKEKALEQQQQCDLTIERNRLIEGGAQRVTLTTPDGVTLDAMYYARPEDDRSRILIRTGGNGEHYEHSLDHLPDIGIPVLAINPRGVGESGGVPTAKGLALDAYTAYHYAIDALGVDPSQMLPYGFSLGGAYSTMGAACIQEEYPDKEINIVNENSFVDLKKETFGITASGCDMLSEKWELEKTASVVKDLGYTAANMACTLIDWTDWQMKSREAHEKLKGRKLIIYHDEGEDLIVPYDASMGGAFRKKGPTRNVYTLRLRRCKSKKNRIYQHCRAHNVLEDEAIKMVMMDMLAHRSYRRILVNDLIFFEPSISDKDKATLHYRLYGDDLPCGKGYLPSTLSRYRPAPPIPIEANWGDFIL